MPLLSVNKSAPRYITVAQTLMQDIESDRYKVGGMLPTETDICERFAISRYTAREAVRQLCDLGMVLRRAGIGTIILSKSVRSSYTASISDPTELFAFTTRTRVHKLEEDMVPIKGEWLKVLPDAHGQVWPRFKSLRYPKGDPHEPIAYTETLVQPAYGAIRDRIHKPGQTVYQLIEELRGERVHALKQEISCIALPRKIAELLQARPGTPALRVLRYYLGSDESLLSVAINTYPQDRFKMTTRWQLSRNVKSG